jgi:hypothetical protein
MPYPQSEKFWIVSSKGLIFKQNQPNAPFSAQPWRCLCRGSLQMTRTTRLRRMILQFRQIFLTDASTFIAVSSINP